MPVRRGGGGGSFPTIGPRGLPYVLCDCIQVVICVSRSDSKLACSRDGSSRWHIGHSSSSAIWGVGGRRRCRDDDAALPRYDVAGVLEGPACVYRFMPGNGPAMLLRCRGLVTLAAAMPWSAGAMEMFLALEVYMLNGSTLGPGANTMPYRFIAGMTP